MVLLKSFQRLGYFPTRLKDVPAPIVAHVRTCLALALGGTSTSTDINTDSDQMDNSGPLPVPVFQTRSLYRHHQSIRRFLGVKTYKEAAQAVAATAIEQAAQVMNNPADLINVAIEKLIKENYELPAYSTLDSLAQRIRTQVNTTLWDCVLSRINGTAQTGLATLLSRPVSLEQARVATELEVELEAKPLSDWARLKQLPKRATLGHFQELLDRLDWPLTLGKVDIWLENVPKAKIHHFAAEARSLKAAELLDYAPAKRYTLLACTIQQAIVTARDNLVEMLLKRVAHLHSWAKEELEVIQKRLRTIFLLKYISSPELRQQITATTNKAEGYNGFSKWVQFGGDGVISQNSPDEQEKQIKYLDLVSNALIYQNVVDLSKTLQILKGEGHPVSREDMAALSPYLTRHIKRFGDYILDLSKEPEPLESDLEIPEEVIAVEGESEAKSSGLTPIVVKASHQTEAEVVLNTL